MLQVSIQRWSNIGSQRRLPDTEVPFTVDILGWISPAYSLLLCEHIACDCNNITTARCSQEKPKLSTEIINRLSYLQNRRDSSWVVATWCHSDLLQQTQITNDCKM